VCSSTSAAAPPGSGCSVTGGSSRWTTAGGGHHLDLVLAGALGISIEEAEVRKREHPQEALPILVPGLQRIGESVRAMTLDAADLPLHLAGGALMIPGAGEVLARYLGRRVVTYPHALLITPIGIARSVP
jgi:ethanolamine utilization protein EutJ